jgi:hypothetical protein
VWCCGGCLAVGKVLPLAIIATGRWCYAATTVDTPTVSPLWSSFGSFCEITCEFSSFSLCLRVHVLVAWPASQACLPAAAAPCWILCLDPALPMLASVYCYC